MGQDKIPITSERKYVFEGVFDIKEIYKILKEFLENNRHYDITEKDYEEKNDAGTKKIMSKIEAEQEYTDYYKAIIKYELNMEGKDVVVQSNGREMKLTKGKVKLAINSYILPDFMNIRPKSGIGYFFDEIYHKYIDKSKLAKCIGSVSGDVSEMIGRFKQTVNSTLK